MKPYLKGVPLEARFWLQVDKSAGQGPHGDCWCWTGTIVGGYGQIRREGVAEYAHRVSYELAQNVRLERVRQGGPLVCHSCDHRPCVRPEHLFLGSFSDNTRDMIEKGRRVAGDQRGQKNHQAKLTPQEVRAIRSDTRLLTEIADDFAIAPSTVCQIRNRRLWAHL